MAQNEILIINYVSDEKRLHFSPPMPKVRLKKLYFIIIQNSKKALKNGFKVMHFLHLATFSNRGKRKPPHMGIKQQPSELTELWQGKSSAWHYWKQRLLKAFKFFTLRSSSLSTLSRDVLNGRRSQSTFLQRVRLGPGWETHWICFFTVSPAHDLKASWQQ